MKDLEVLADKAVAIIEECCKGVEIMEVERPLTINTRAKARWGQCKRNITGVNTINISADILEDGVPDDAALSVVIHEFLHACRGTNGHKGLWKKYAECINRKYPQYKIQRADSAEKFGLPEERRIINRPYAIQCERCGNIHSSSRLSKSILYPERYICKCGGKLHRIA